MSGCLRHLLIAIVCFCLCASASGARITGSGSYGTPVIQEGLTAEQHVQNARVAVRSARYDDAKNELKAALKIDKNSPSEICFSRSSTDGNTNPRRR